MILKVGVEVGSRQEKLYKLCYCQGELIGVPIDSVRAEAREPSYTSLDYIGVCMYTYV